MTIEESNEVKGSTIKYVPWALAHKTMMGNGARIKNRSAGIHDRGLAARNTAQVGLARYERLAVLARWPMHDSRWVGLGMSGRKSSGRLCSH
jgi:hypothetical protein